MSLEKFRHESNRWLLQAQSDLKAAENSTAAGDYDWACFQAQQAGEKALKALWLFHTVDPRGHSLTKPIEEFPDEMVKAELMPLMPNAKSLDKLYIPTRYPNGLPDSIPAEVYTGDEAHAAIATAREVVERAKSTIAEAGQSPDSPGAPEYAYIPNS